MPHHTIPIKFSIGTDELEIVAAYKTADPGNYTIISATHNGTDITAFYQLCETQNECIFYPQITEGIAADICTRRLDSGIWSTNRTT